MGILKKGKKGSSGDARRLANARKAANMRDSRARASQTSRGRGGPNGTGSDTGDAGALPWRDSSGLPGAGRGRKRRRVSDDDDVEDGVDAESPRKRSRPSPPSLRQRRHLEQAARSRQQVWASDGEDDAWQPEYLGADAFLDEHFDNHDDDDDNNDNDNDRADDARADDDRADRGRKRKRANADLSRSKPPWRDDDHDDHFDVDEDGELGAVVRDSPLPPRHSGGPSRRRSHMASPRGRLVLVSPRRLVGSSPRRLVGSPLRHVARRYHGEIQRGFTLVYPSRWPRLLPGASEHWLFACQRIGFAKRCRGGAQVVSDGRGARLRCGAILRGTLL